MNVEHGSAGDMHTTQSRLSCGATRRRRSENQNSQMLTRGKDDVSTGKAGAAWLLALYAALHTVRSETRGGPPHDGARRGGDRLHVYAMRLGDVAGSSQVNGCPSVQRLS